MKYAHLRPKILHLSLKKEPFEVMVTGEKTNEYRKTTSWLRARLTNKDGTEKQYDYIKFVNGYGYDKPYFIIEYKGVTLNTCQHILQFSNGLTVPVDIGDTIIFCGKITKVGNIH